jgi:hypothetical protein
MVDEGTREDLLAIIGELDARFRKLNFFRAVGAARAERRHSDFLGFLLDPFETHNLADGFLKAWLHSSLNAPLHGTLSDSTADRIRRLLADDLRDSEVERERGYIDLLVLNRRMRVALIIENKVDYYEREGQLARYWDRVGRVHPEFDRVGIYLTAHSIRPEGSSEYLAVNYETVHDGVSKTLEGLSPKEPELTTLLRHYRDLVREEFMDNSEKLDLAWTIFAKHPQAADFLEKNGHRIQILNEIEELIDSASSPGHREVEAQCRRGLFDVHASRVAAREAQEQKG